MKTDRTPAATTRTDIAIAILRATIGAIFLAHGAQKLFVFGVAGVTGAFAQMGAPLPGITGPATALVEFFAGLAVISGLLTRLSALGLAITMLGAISIVHIGNGFFSPTGIEFPLALLGATVALAVNGGGRYSLDALIARRNAGTTPAASATSRTIEKAA